MATRQLGGRYALQDEMGAEGTSVVYRAVDTRVPGRVVATKVLHGRSAPNASTRERFRRERRLLAVLEHPNLLSLFDSGTDGETDWIVMEHARSGSLRDVLEQDGPFDVHGALMVVLQVLGALGAVHRCGVVHRAVGLDNILLGHRGQILLGDLAHALVQGVEDVDTGARYVADAAPEQRRAPLEAGPEADVYSVAKVLVVLLTGRQAGEIGTYSFQDPRWGRVPDWLRPVVRDAAALNPGERFGHAESFARALLDVARRYQHPRVDELDAVWAASRPRNSPRTLWTPAPPAAPPVPVERAGFGSLSVLLGSTLGGLLVGAGLLWVASWIVLG